MWIQVEASLEEQRVHEDEPLPWRECVYLSPFQSVFPMLILDNENKQKDRVVQAIYVIILIIIGWIFRSLTIPSNVNCCSKVNIIISTCIQKMSVFLWSLLFEVIFCLLC